MYSDTQPSDIPNPCECCAQAHVWRDGLCRSCDAAERNLVQAELADRCALESDDVDALALTTADNDDVYRGDGPVRRFLDLLDAVVS